MSYENWKIAKSEFHDKAEEYSAVAKWCNESRQYHIEEIGDEYCVVANPELTTEEINADRIAELKRLLADSDYVVIKIAEGAATAEEYAELIEQRKAWRAEINELESQSENVQEPTESGSENVQE